MWVVVLRIHVWVVLAVVVLERSWAANWPITGRHWIIFQTWSNSCFYCIAAWIYENVKQIKTVRNCNKKNSWTSKMQIIKKVKFPKEKWILFLNFVKLISRKIFNNITWNGTANSLISWWTRNSFFTSITGGCVFFRISSIVIFFNFVLQEIYDGVKHFDIVTKKADIGTTNYKGKNSHGLKVGNNKLLNVRKKAHTQWR